MGGGMNISYGMALKNRKVAGQESLSVPAGLLMYIK
jgi:hypothetical protein